LQEQIIVVVSTKAIEFKTYRKEILLSPTIKNSAALLFDFQSGNQRAIQEKKYFSILLFLLLF